jgi:hypothetical protein
MACCSKKDIFNVGDPAAMPNFTHEKIHKATSFAQKQNFQDKVTSKDF